ncbi:MAG: glycosyltransferase, partial [Kiritimatiellae bacterium]|nr:glycosyltransferase [Kiritimatiellia bacterium]
MRRVLFISPQPYFQWRGSPIRVAFDAQALSEAGWMVDLVVMPVGEDHPLPNVAVHRPMNIFRINKLAIGPSAVKAFLDIFLFCTALKLAFKNRYDIIHGVEEAGAMAVVLGKLRGAKVIFEKHSDPASYKKGFVRNAVMWLYSQVEKFSIRHADAVIGTGPALVEQA